MRLPWVDAGVLRRFRIEDLQFTHSRVRGIAFAGIPNCQSIVSTRRQFEFEMDRKIGVGFFGIQHPCLTFSATNRTVCNLIAVEVSGPAGQVLTIEQRCQAGRVSGEQTRRFVVEDLSNEDIFPADLGPVSLQLDRPLPNEWYDTIVVEVVFQNRMIDHEFVIQMDCRSSSDLDNMKTVPLAKRFVSVHERIFSRRSRAIVPKSSRSFVAAVLERRRICGVPNLDLWSPLQINAAVSLGDGFVVNPQFIVLEVLIGGQKKSMAIIDQFGILDVPMLSHVLQTLDPLGLAFLVRLRGVDMQRSLDVPVILDFWAPWCQPCQQLAPILEKLAAESAGEFVLAKINTDEQPQLAQAFGVQSLPMVVAFVQGQPVDQFVGLLTEAQIREWLAPLKPTPAQTLARQAAALVETNPQAAESKYREALALAPEEDSLKACLASVLLKQDRLDECQVMIDSLAQRGFLEPEVERIKMELEVRTAAAESGGVDQARKTAEADPANLILKVRLADALAASSQHRKALELCLEVVLQDVSEARAEAKETMIKIFAILGPASELTGEFRRKLSTALY